MIMTVLHAVLLVLGLAVGLGTAEEADGSGLTCSSPELRLFPYCDPSLSPTERARDLVKRMTLTEKITTMRMTNDQSPMNNSGVPRLGVPPLFISECLHGVGEGGNDLCTGKVCPTVYPSPSALGCSFNRSSWYAIGTAVGREARALRNEGKAAGLVCWAPVVNLVRDPRVCGANHLTPQHISVLLRTPVPFLSTER